ncbi:uncharacterized protein LOC127871835 isoform X2 [Dreissena polymorpha]|uniref:Uncharacterized protein n=1 Tax=Dreissena polymorpha TaxID=45954 RepID=A0A9D4R8V1_DREPO|nr:uncharacterized protein LOC127871835 isoform X2 [Dreissena polymorpha]KAH3859336.1 hypothetical protein DPMN_102055 [Dreissena polymorpha]
MSQQKATLPSISSDTYEDLKLEVMQYENIPEHRTDYIYPTSGARGPREGAAPPTPPPPPPKRDSGRISLNLPNSDGVMFKKESIADVTLTRGQAKPDSPVNVGPKTRVFKRDTLMPSVVPVSTISDGKEMYFYKQKNAGFDSGVGDLEHIHIDGSQPKTYDYADYGHQYEELPNRKSIAKSPFDSQMDSRSELYPSSGSGSMSETGNTSNNISNQSEKRKRVNPLYDTNTQSMPSIYNKSSKEDSNRALNKQIRCLKCALIVFVVLTFAALAVSMFAVISHMQTKDQADPILTPQVAKLSDSYSRLEQLLASFEGNNNTIQVLSDLIQKVNKIESNLTADISDLRTKTELNSETTQQNMDRILGTHANISDVISQLNTTLQLQLHTITKMEGPRGPQGVANFSQCTYDDVTDDSVASDINSSYTPWLLTPTKLQTSVVLFATCLVEGGLTAMLEVQKLAPDRVQYRCRCSGKVIDKTRRLCTIHVLSCPRYS